VTYMIKSLFVNKSIRKKEYNYSHTGSYFITICVKNCVNPFGVINQGKMIMNDTGLIVDDKWKQIPDHFENIEIDTHVIMPNHFHGIIKIIDDNDIVGHRHAYDLHFEKRQHQRLPVIIGSFKAAASRDIHKALPEFNWQSSYYDRIIRNEKEYLNIQLYIAYNPLRWDYDIENPDCNRINSKELGKLVDEYYEKLCNGFFN